MTTGPGWDSIATMQGGAYLQPNGVIISPAKSTVLMKNTTSDKTALFNVHVLDWKGDWLTNEAKSIAPQTEAKFGGDDKSRAITDLTWELVAEAPTGGAPQAPSVIKTDLDNFVAEVTKNLWVVFAIIIVLVILFIAAVWAMGGGQGVAALGGMIP